MLPRYRFGLFQGNHKNKEEGGRLRKGAVPFFLFLFLLCLLHLAMIPHTCLDTLSGREYSPLDSDSAFTPLLGRCVGPRADTGDNATALSFSLPRGRFNGFDFSSSSFSSYQCGIVPSSISARQLVLS
ncbi:hypothetical protein SODALDRAFT_122289 [Sodiomyces alkalinus F11]|uniref:Uncharacterized protein n=1 Tax=Sodiomyces alkalinus (strain CBS 110278 / VKM F-3762 / F11) TaxID=1314773 RepID=A0A3N2Q444_SODAK|nr:hypothetical protein SODALDRAFT_122289 [Sodiomyces alkalinus F11]ROT41544.1 hypothetical protein SODALDRAFT_122289 [Sodiomyces alkalinus F11]